MFMDALISIHQIFGKCGETSAPVCYRGEKISKASHTMNHLIPALLLLAGSDPCRQINV